MSHTVLEVNGKRYNAITGELLDAPKANYSVPKASNGHSIDGFTAPKPLAPLHTAVQNHSVPKSPRMKSMSDITLNHRHKPQKSQTLMRKTVVKPAHPVHHALIAASHHQPSRSDRAMLTPTHPAVRKFNAEHTPKQTTPIVAHMPVAQQSSAPAPHVAQTSLHKQTAMTTESFISQQLSKETAPTASHSVQSEKKKFGFLRSKKLLSFSAGTLACLVLAGFLIWQNMPAISVAVASRKSGLSVRVPDGIPSNFALSREVIYSKGEVTFAYKSRVDDRHFTITTQDSQDMTSQSLESAIALNTKGNYQTYQADGITLFITGPGIADWIDGGQRFNVSGESGLSSEQLAKIASSL